MRVAFGHKIPGEELAAALREVASSFEESHEVIQTTTDRLEPGSVKRVLDTLKINLTWRERGLTRGRFGSLLRREPREKATGYGYGLRCSEIGTDKECDSLDITGETYSPLTYYGAYSKRPQDIAAADELLDKFVGALFKNLGLNDEAPQGA